MTKFKMMDRKEQADAMRAMQDWMESQEIRPQDSAWLMATMAGFIMAAFATDQKSTEEGVEILAAQMLKSAMFAFEDRVK